MEDNESLKKNLIELKEKYKAHLSTFAKEIEDLKHKLNDKGHFEDVKEFFS